MTAPAADLMSPLALFLHADIVVKAVMIGLLLASVWTWGIIITHARRLKQINRDTRLWERDFWAAKDIDAYHDARGKDDVPSARIVTAGLKEWRHSVGLATSDRSGARERLTTVMSAEVEGELDRLVRPAQHPRHRRPVRRRSSACSARSGASCAASPPSRAPTTRSLAVVAPGIAEALFATAIGLFAAIPAVIAYNRLTHGLDRLEARLNRFADRFHATLSRELERG